MKNRPQSALRAASSSDSKDQAKKVLSDYGAVPQAQSANTSQLSEGIHLAAISRGPRDRTRAINFSLREFNGHEFLDIRQYRSSSGFMIRTDKGLTISIAQLGKFAHAAGNAYRRAVALGLTRASS